MGWFKKNTDTKLRPVKMKKGFRLPKRKRFRYEADCIIKWNGKEMGIVPINVVAFSGNKAKQMIEKEVTLEVARVIRSKKK